CAALIRCLDVNRAWGTPSAAKCIEAIETWLAGDASARMEGCDELAAALFTQKGEVRSLKSLEKLDANYPGMADRVRACLDAVRQQRALLALVELLTPALTVGRRFALACEEAKRREGLVDFDDLIRRAAGLLAEPGLGEWIRYKLDRRIDHILVDEAQDTNEPQWAIIRALTEDFFTGLGQRDGKLRTIFVVGDYKQAIFRFQGTSPENFRIAKEQFAREMAAAARNVAELRDGLAARELRDLDLGRSYRTSKPVLEFVDAAIDAIGPENFGLDQAPDRHVGEERPGLVTLWNPV